MTKKELIDRLYERCRQGFAVGVGHYRPSITKAGIAAVLYHLPQIIHAEMLAGGKVELNPAGNFEARWVGGRMEGQEAWLIAEFKWSASMKSAIARARRS